MKTRTQGSAPRQRPAAGLQHTVPTPADRLPATSALARAVALHQQGKLSDAEALYREVLAETPAHADALHLLGVLKAQSKQAGEAVGLIGQAIRLAPDNPMFYSNLGSVLKDLRRFDAALASFDKALALDPQLAEGWSNRGNVLRELGRTVEALASYDRALALRPQTPEAHYNRAGAALKLGRLDDAVASYDRAITLRPGYAEAWCNRAVALRELNRTAAALASCERALALQPECVEALYQRGNALHSLERYDDALASYERALTLRPDYADALAGRGATLRRMQRLGESLASYDRALAVQPHHAEALCNRGITLHDMRRLDDALAAYERALEVRPNYAEAMNNRGTALKELQRFDEALAAYERTLQIRPGYAEAEYNRANTLKEMERLDDALAGYDRAIAQKPDFAAAHSNRGTVLMDLQRLDEAQAAFARATQIRPEFAEAHWNESLCLLLAGKFEAGWAKYEWRYRKNDTRAYRRAFTAPLWLGEEELRGRTIFVYAEQGFGDTLQFCRYVALLAERGATAILEVQAALKALLQQVAGAAQVLGRGEPLPPFDFQTPLLSLPLAVGTTAQTIPATVPYVHPDPSAVARWQGRLGKRSGPLIGLVWSGSPTHKNDRHRSLALTDLAPILDLEATFISLQREVRASDADFLTRHPRLRHFGPDLEDFAATAALIAHLDLVVTVDTAVAHLAGAMAKPVWILLPYLGLDWRWQASRDDSPWYPTARLFRQPEIGAWTAVVARLAAELAREFKVARVSATPSQAAGAAPATAGAVTDLARWSQSRALLSAWDDRAEVAARLIPAGAHVLDIGCGKMALEKFLPLGCTYQPCDLVARDARTLVCDLNRDALPHTAAHAASILVLLGVVEYLADVPRLLARLRASGKPIVVSYHPTDVTAHLDRRKLGWLNDFSMDAWLHMLAAAGLYATNIERLSEIQFLFKLAPNPPGPPASMKKVAVLSYANVGNFGDRLGYHLLNAVLPAGAEVTHYFHRPWQEPALEDVDLLVCGIGNSLFAPLLTPELVRLVESAKHSIGIFGTQYRSAIDRHVLAAFLGRLNHWFARSEEDLNLYGGLAGSASHLGDWLIDAFPLARGSRNATLSIGDEIWQDLPLDRTIQKIQAYRIVRSTRLHPLLCALTSAERVAYSEQRQAEPAGVSGKFRSLLYDVFGRDYPADVLFDVDRAKVAAYKATVSANVAALRAHIATVLGFSATC